MSADELAILQRDLGRILEWVGQIGSLELDQVEPFFGIAPPQNRTREDEAVAGLSRDEVLNNASVTSGPFFVVPPVKWSSSQSAADRSPTDIDS